jgi:hypothetical protein
MEQTLLTAGLACIIAAVVGGGLEAFGIKIPLLNSTRRKAALALLGLALLVVPILNTFFRTAVISGKVFDVISNQPISGVRLTLVDSNGKVVEQDIFTTAQDGGFQFIVPHGINKTQLPLHFQLSRSRWAANYVPEERVTDFSSDRQINLPVDLASLIVVTASPPRNTVVATGTRTTPTPSSKPGKDQPDQSPPPASVVSNSEGLTLLKTGTISLLVRGSHDYLDFEVHVRPTDSPSLKFDVNKNNVIDRNVDVSYGLTSADGLCTQYLLTLESRTGCGVFHSESTVEIRRGVDAGVPVKIVLWHIPKQEINAENGDAHLTVDVFNAATNGWSYFPSQDFSQTIRTSKL